ncbi:MAG: FAD-binding oxidoreductase [Hydrogenophaga sp.]|nr:FAD-binding oxidoreductase [Hydrogenophaga sp.]
MNPLLTSLREAFAGRLLLEATDTAAFLTDWRHKWTGQALAVAQPDTPTDVAAVLRWCHTHQVPVVPQGGNTGLSGGATPDASGQALVLSLTRLKRVRAIDPINNTITVDAGVTLLQVQEAAQQAGRLFPLGLAAEGSCTIGGNLATNAGGVQVLRYGNARELCLGLAMERDWLSDAALSSSLSQCQALWALREDISEAQGAEGTTIKHDIALPISRIADFIEHTSAAIHARFDGVRLVVFGHLGDGNLHFNLSPATDRLGPDHSAAFVALEAPLNRLVHDAVVACGGSISAEHGLGVLRRDESARYKAPVELALMRAIKQALDPLNLMNPGKTLT